MPVVTERIFSYGRIKQKNESQCIALPDIVQTKQTTVIFSSKAEIETNSESPWVLHKLRKDTNFYGREAFQHRLLEPWEEVATVKKRDEAKQEGNTTDYWAAVDYLADHNLRLLLDISQQYIGKGLPFNDIVQEGYFGLRRAAELFDPFKKDDQGNAYGKTKVEEQVAVNTGEETQMKFSTYATRRIRTEIGRAIKDQNYTITVPHQIVDKFNCLRKKQEITIEQQGREATLEELAQEIECSVDEVSVILRAFKQQPISLDATTNDGNTNIASVITGKSVSNIKVEETVLAKISALRILRDDRISDLDRRIIYQSFFEDKTPTEIAEELGKKRPAVSMAKTKAVRKLGIIAQSLGITNEDL